MRKYATSSSFLPCWCCWLVVLFSLVHATFQELGKKLQTFSEFFNYSLLLFTSFFVNARRKTNNEMVQIGYEETEEMNSAWWFRWGKLSDSENVIRSTNKTLSIVSKLKWIMASTLFVFSVYMLLLFSFGLSQRRKLFSSTDHFDLDAMQFRRDMILSQPNE